MVRGAGLFVLSSAALCALATAWAPALAQTSPYIIDNDRIDRAAPEPTQAPPIDELRGRSAIDQNSPAQVGEAATVDLRAVHIHGSSLPPAMLERAWRAEVGGTLDSARIARISDALTAIYRRSDVALFTIIAPRQDLSGGTLDLYIAEGRVSGVQVQTDQAQARDIGLIRAYASRLIGAEPLSRAALERQLSLMREIPGQRVDARFVPISPNSNQVRMVITARRNRADFGVALSHRPTPLLGDTQVNADLALNGWLRGGDRLGLAVSTSAQDDLFRYYGLAYSTPLGADGWRAALNLSSLRTRPDLIPTEGRATSGAFVLSYPLHRTVSESTTISFGFDALNNDNSVFGQVLDSSRTRVMRSSLTMSAQNNRRARAISLSASVGLDSFGARVNPLIGDADFFKLAGQASWTRVLGERAMLRLRAQAQASADDLPASERLALGGEQYGRAFASGLVQGDQGVAASFEAAYRPRFPSAPALGGSETYAFVDGGTVWMHERPLSPDMDDSMSSYGIGARIAIGRRLTLGIEIARPIASPAADTDDDDWRLTYSVRARDGR